MMTIWVHLMKLAGLDLIKVMSRDKEVEAKILLLGTSLENHLIKNMVNIIKGLEIKIGKTLIKKQEAILLGKNQGSHHQEAKVVKNLANLQETNLASLLVVVIMLLIQ